MPRFPRPSGAALSAALCCLSVHSAVRADDPQTVTDLANQIKALQAEVTQLKSQQNENWLTEERASQIRGIVQDVLADAKSRGQSANGIQSRVQRRLLHSVRGPEFQAGDQRVCAGALTN